MSMSMKRLLIALALFLVPALAQAQCNGAFSANRYCGTGASSGVPGQQSFTNIFNNLPLANGNIYVGNASGIATGVAPTGTGDCTFTFSNLGAFGYTCLKTNGVPFGPLATPTFAPLANGGLGGSQSAATANQVPVYPGSGGAAVPTSATTWFDTVYCNTVGWIIARTTGAWTCAQGVPVNVEWFNILPGNSAATNSTNLTNLLSSIPKSQFLFPRDGYNFNATFTLTASQSIACAYRSDPTVSGNLIQTSTSTDLFHIHGGYVTIQGCTLDLAGSPAGAKAIVIGDDAVQVSTGNSITSGNAQITCTSCTFTSGDVGKEFTAVGAGASGGPLLGTIATFVDSTHVTVSPTPGTNQTNTTIGYGFNYQEDDIIDSTIDNFSNAISIVAATQYHIRHVYALGPDPLTIANIIWADQGDGTIVESTFVGSVAGSHNTVIYNSGGGLRFNNNKVLAQAAITSCIDVLWNGAASSVGPWIIGNSIEGPCSTGIAVNGSGTQTANGGIISNNEIGIASAGTSIGLLPTTAHPNWLVSNNLIRQTGGGSGITTGSMSGLVLGPNAGQNTDGNGGGLLYNIGSATTGTVYVTSTNIINAISNSSANMVIDDPVGMAFASLPSSAANGSRIFVSNGAPASSPCTGASTGSTAFRQNGAWKCF